MRYYKDVVNWFFWVLWRFKLNKLKVNLSICRKPLCLLAGKKSASSPMLYWRYCKDMQTSYFGYFGNLWLHTPKNDRLTHFILQNFKRIVRADPELLGCAIFGQKNGPFALSKFFLIQAIFITFIYLLALFIVQNLEKVVRMLHFGLKMVHLSLFSYNLRTRFFPSMQFSQNVNDP